MSLFYGLDLRTHGGKVCHALAEGLHHVAHLKEFLSKLQHLHTFTLKLSKEQVMWLLDLFKDIIKKNFSIAFNEYAQMACDKYFGQVSCILTGTIPKDL
ncbi:hemoglobin larval subunit alpha-like [Dendropsophus ebraccatus]|uniref:hemoglobin larval subunit alpha-like n=1 Tax=Dendropsophus ebraccatus TaxID=150705 RepID=UPI00383170FB